MCSARQIQDTSRGRAEVLYERGGDCTQGVDIYEYCAEVINCLGEKYVEVFSPLYSSSPNNKKDKFFTHTEQNS